LFDQRLQFSQIVLSLAIVRFNPKGNPPALPEDSRSLTTPGVDRSLTFVIIREVSESIAERYEVEMERVGCDLNHIHVLCGAHPKYAPGQLVRLFKSITAREVFRRVKGLRQELWGGEFWSDGYYVATVGERGDWSVVEKYVRNQGHSPEAVQLRLL